MGMLFFVCRAKAPKGLAEAFLIGEKFIENSSVVLILGDNLFHEHTSKNLAGNNALNGGHIFAYRVKDPQRYGVVEFGKNNQVIGLEEKPKMPKSPFAVPGLYLYDHTVVEKAKKLSPSKRGELEITEINQQYLTEGKLKVSS